MASVPRLSRLERAILLTVGYSDQFEYPLTRQEIWRRLIRTTSSPKEHWTPASFRTALQQLKDAQLLLQKGPFFALSGRSNLFVIRTRRSKIARQKQLVVEDFLRQIKQIPWIQVVFVTGSLAMANTEPEHDIDLMIVTTPRRLWLSRLWVTWIAWRAGRRRETHTEIPDSWCLNLWLDTEHLQLPIELHSVYTAYEVTQAVPVYDRQTTIQQFFIQNEWVTQFLPNWQFPQVLRRKRSTRISSKTQLFLSGFFDCLDWLAWTAQFFYMWPHRTTERVGRGYAFFHPRNTAALVKKRWQASLKSVIRQKSK